MRLKDAYKDINKGKVEARLNTAFGYFRIMGVNREDWTVKVDTGGGYTRTFYCTPDTRVRIEKIIY